MNTEQTSKNIFKYNFATFNQHCSFCEAVLIKVTTFLIRRFTEILLQSEKVLIQVTPKLPLTSEDSMTFQSKKRYMYVK